MHVVGEEKPAEADKEPAPAAEPQPEEPTPAGESEPAEPKPTEEGEKKEGEGEGEKPAAQEEGEKKEGGEDGEIQKAEEGEGEKKEGEGEEEKQEGDEESQPKSKRSASRKKVGPQHWHLHGIYHVYGTALRCCGYPWKCGSPGSGCLSRTPQYMQVHKEFSGFSFHSQNLEDNILLPTRANLHPSSAKVRVTYSVGA